ncbi:AcnD-accessory protein PrpF [Ceratobasidium sp. AG-Ba]|nr:AcnD-accessory protein PrpF [Ceratobasidium sp. AG-Ba]
MQRFLSAHFCRGGTSKGLFFQDHAFAKVSQETRNKIILAAMGSPDPDGLWGRNLFIIQSSHPPRAWCRSPRTRLCERNGWDVVYRFCQVGVREPELDWGSTCGNLVSAAAMTAINWNLVPTESVLHSMANEESTTLPVRILAANNGLIVTAKVPVMLSPSRTVVPITGGDAVISGVPGTGAPIVIETPILQAPLRTKHSRETLSIDGNEAS